MLVVEEGKDEDGDGGGVEVVLGIEHLVEEHLAGEEREEPEEEQGRAEEDVLVEHEADEVGVASVALAAMEEEEGDEEAELRKGVV